MKIQHQAQGSRNASPPSQRMIPILRSALAIGIGLLLLAGLTLQQTATPYDTPGRVLAAPAASCTEGNLPSQIVTDTTRSGDLFVTQNVDVKDGATLTLTAGTRVTLCGPYDIEFNNGALHAVGTAAAPIVFEGETATTEWERLFFNGSGGPLLPSTLHHVIVDGGGYGSGADSGAIHIYAADGTAEPGVVLDTVTVRNSGAYGIAVRHHDSDATPPLLSNLTITNSASAPLLFWASAVGGLGTGNAFSDNGAEAIQVRAGVVLGGRIFTSQTWSKQPIPYHMVGEFGGLDINHDTYPTLTVMPGTTFKMDPDFQIRISKGRLMAEGTAFEPITFEAADPSQPWRRIYFNGSANEVPTMTLQHVILDGGGGSDPTAVDGALYLYAPSGTVGSGPVMDQITIRDSGSHGLVARVTESDESPMALSNLKITGSAGAPLYLWGAAVGGLGPDNVLTGNAQDAILINGSGLGGSLDYDATWRRQTAPYRLLNQLTVSDPRSPVLTIEPGVTVEFTTTAGIKVNRGGVVIEGTPTEPITLTRAPGATTWGRLFFEDNIDPASRIAHTTFEYAGGAGGAITYNGESLTLDNVTVRYATNAGLYTRGTFVQVKESRFEQNGEGLRFQYGAGGVLRNNVIANNGAGITVLSNSKGVCIDAMGNYWGAAEGPSDSIGAIDACNLTTTNAGGGESLSADVLYRPWLSGMPGDGALDGSQIEAEDFWVIGDGVATTTLTIKARDAQGTPLVGKQIALETTRGVIQQPGAPTDADGVTRAVISSAETGPAQITAFNTTDGEPLAALASLMFWQGQGEDAGLIPPGGAPFASPQLIIEGKPFEQGLPMVFRVPMQNTNAVPIEVTVVYRVSRLNIGARFTAVYTATETLQPGELWDAAGSWIPPVTGHHCVQALVEVDLPDGQRLNFRPLVIVNVGPFQVNLKFMPPDPCQALDPTKLIPSYGGLPKVVKHFRKALVQSYLANECLKQNLTFGSGAASAGVQPLGLTAARAYQAVAPPPVVTMPSLVADSEVSQAEADAANAIGETAAELIALDIAIATARERAEQAGDADDAMWIERQMTAYRDYQTDKGAALQRLSARIDAYLAITRDAGEPDTRFMPTDYAAYLAELTASGYDAETIAFHRELGRSDGAIAEQLTSEIITLENNTFFATSFYELLESLRATAEARGRTLVRTYGQATSRALTAAAPDAYFLGELSTHFVVGNPQEAQRTVELVVRPVQLPLDWSYALSDPAPVLGPGETTTVTLTLNVGHGVPLDSKARVSVEGYIGDELVGGILFEQVVPAAGARAVYLPLVIRNQN